MFITIKGYLQLGLEVDDYDDPFEDEMNHFEDDIDRLIAETNKAKKKEEPDIATPKKVDPDKFDPMMINVNNISTIKPKGSNSKLHCIMLYDGFSVVTNESFETLNKKISNATLGFKIN